MAKNKPFIGIKRIWYGNPLAAACTPTTLAAWLQTATEVLNSHDGTWGYSQDDPSVTDYINELNGQTYYRDKTSEGAKTITFSIGVYSWKNKTDLQGGQMLDDNGAVTSDAEKACGWSSGQDLDNINKCLVAQTKTGNYIVFSNAAIVGKGDQQDKNIALGVTAVAMESEATGVEAEYLWDGDKVTVAQNVQQTSEQKAAKV